jgi:hypothetical protein
MIGVEDPSSRLETGVAGVEVTGLEMTESDSASLLLLGPFRFDNAGGLTSKDPSSFRDRFLFAVVAAVVVGGG